MINKEQLIDYIRYKSEFKQLSDLKSINGVRAKIEESIIGGFYKTEAIAYLERHQKERLKYYNHGEAFFEQLAERIIGVCDTHSNVNTWVLNTLKNGHKNSAWGDIIEQKDYIDLIINEGFSVNYFLEIIKNEEKHNLKRVSKDRHKVINAIALLKNFSDNANLHYELDKLANQEIETELTKKIIYKSAFFNFARKAHEDLKLPRTTQAKDLANDLLYALFDHETKYKPSNDRGCLPYKNGKFFYYK